MASGGIATVRSVLPVALLLGSAAVHQYLLSRQQARRGEHKDGQGRVLKQVQQHPSLVDPGLGLLPGTSPSPPALTRDRAGPCSQAGILASSFPS